MDHGFQAVDFHCLIEGPFLGYIGHDTEIELGGWGLGMRISDFLGFFFRADCCGYRVAVLEEDVEDMRSDETAATCCCVIRTPFSMQQWGNEGQEN
jgi:hypothetical protein